MIIVALVHTDLNSPEHLQRTSISTDRPREGTTSPPEIDECQRNLLKPLLNLRSLVENDFTQRRGGKLIAGVPQVSFLDLLYMFLVTLVLADPCFVSTFG